MKAMKAAGQRIRRRVRAFLTDESGMGTIEVILIIVVLIGLVIIFRAQLNGLIEKIFKTIKEDVALITD